MLLDPNQLSALSAILRLGSFEAAAAELAVTPSAVSQRIKALEDRVGASLIHRVTPCTGTPAGLRIARYAEDVGLLEAQLARDLALEQNPRSARVRIAVPADVLATWFIDAMAQVPDMLFDLVVDDQDHSADWLKRGEVSAAVTVGGRPVTGCDVTALGVLRYLPTASPSFINTWFKDGVNEGTLSKAPCLVFNQKDGLQKAWLSQYIAGQMSPPFHFLPSSNGFVDAAIAGLGWGMNPAVLAKDALEQGRLLPLLTNAPLDVALSWQVGRVLAPALKPLTHAVQRAAKQVLLPPSAN
ncbi:MULTISPECIES: LysR family transcriptional regulator ArgP [unclassified Ruegeria]|uniref:LysR family transcriptional regulator ArgP n=1 Tax=unclassified Ruegeria TaxID=2625375 RepID=UPI00148931CA|nr:MULTISPECIES: LysR family transcriptional regulator ArgP [unclassified Ruegeria]NOD74664.1 ArgP/LysG family DNA-binding transcriptional regulator [Ruegeria sp. HKCCD4332]NOD88602.1 ArgP/LysG family DNA-binding transcriptional regulator [Ruegeria sp. HKCCD4318]NOE12170.1 ArgP/LysG family DNA-binding transcriptional regulator [Ruegeria sp. HKCCD4318-2]NOG09665.1 LysR family transcriptional regulator ArgP [Ruegeria sp. HKCCD4315]